MIFNKTDLVDAYTIDPKKLEDERGFFARAWCQKEFEEHGLQTRYVQCNMSYNPARGTLRGVHYQISPYEETKLVRCIRGAIYDVIIDLRPQSATYMRWIGVELSAENRRMLCVPEGFAHGFQTLCDDTEVFYQLSQFYQPGAESGIRWNDSTFGIEWPDVASRIISEKDQNWPDFTAPPVEMQPAGSLS